MGLRKDHIGRSNDYSFHSRIKGKNKKTASRITRRRAKARVGKEARLTD